MDDSLSGPGGDLSICGSEGSIARATAGGAPVFFPESDIDFAKIRSAFGVALHMHQPLIPAGEGHPPRVISNLRFMFEHPQVPDAHNASVFRWCYKRMGEFIPQLIGQGKSPRVLLDYSGCLLYGLCEMGAYDVIDSLKRLAHEPACRRCVEWLGTAWGHAVAPSTPARDFRRHVVAWQHQFAALFGLEALGRVKGFSPPEMALPNHPDAAHEFVRTLKETGYRWVLVQEHSVERAEDGGPVRRPHVPHRLECRNSLGETASMIAIVKTQGSDTKLVAQMQPYYHGRELSRVELGGVAVPQMVTQIGDGENGGVMMNEFPPKFQQVMCEASGSSTPALGVTEYLEHLAAAGVGDEDLPVLRPLFQKRIWDRFGAGVGPEKLEAEIDKLRQEDGRFHVEGGSWTGERSWVRGYDNVLAPMEAASSAFHEKTRDMATTDPRFQKALFYLMLGQTSCFRYWGQGAWTDYGRELCRRSGAALSGG
jgi:hypothetical protein